MEITDVLRKAYEANASDIHLMPGRPVILRIYGKITVCTDMDVLPEDMEAMLHVLLTQMQWKELEEFGEIDVAVTVLEQFRVRANVYSQKGEYAASIHLLASEIPTPKNLGIPDCVLEMTKERKGLILVSGEAGSGKSTTIASLLSETAKREPKHIITIGHPTEYLLPHGKGMVSQIEIGSDMAEYAEAVRAALHQDPDVLFIDDLKDSETTSEAIKAAETGHLVFAVLHTCQIEDTLHLMIDRFLNFRRQEIQERLAKVLKCVVTQQLLPRRSMDGQCAVFEVMLADKEIQALIREGRYAGVFSAMEQKRQLGMQTMDDAILSAYMMSEISEETAVSYAVDSEKMRNRMKIY